MEIMEDSMAHPRLNAGVDLPAWKTALSITCAVLMAALFLAAGIWKVTDPYGSAIRLSQFKIPGALSLPFAVLLGTAEVFCGVLLLVPRFRRWGAWLTSALLAAFMIYVGIFYEQLRGEECQCFPIVKRAIGPGFFIADTVWLLMAVAAGWWARPSESLRSAAAVLGAIAVFAGASFGVATSQNTGKLAPAFITVDGKRTALGPQRMLLYFYDPECTHCDEAARRMSKWNWKDTVVIAIPTRQQQFAAEFMQSTGLRGGTSLEVDELKKTFPFGDPPYGVALENGRQTAALGIFDKAEPEQTLRKMGYIE